MGLTDAQWAQLRYRLGIDGSSQQPQTVMRGHNLLPETLSRLADGSGHIPTRRDPTINLCFNCVSGSTTTVICCVQSDDPGIPLMNSIENQLNQNVFVFSSGGCQGAARAIQSSTYDPVSRIHVFTIRPSTDPLPAEPQNGDEGVLMQYPSCLDP